MTANRKWFLEVSPRIYAMSGPIFELGTVRYEVDSETLAIMGDVGDYTRKTVLPMMTISDQMWAKIEFTIEIKPGEVPQPRPIPTGNPVPMIGMHEHDPRSHVSPEIPRPRGIAPRNSDDER